MDSVAGGPKIAVGTYKGNQAFSSTTAQSISLSFAPKMVLVYALGEFPTWSGTNPEVEHGMCVSGVAANDGNNTVLAISGSGFRAANTVDGNFRWCLNRSGVDYMYFAIG